MKNLQNKKVIVSIIILLILIIVIYFSNKSSNQTYQSVNVGQNVSSTSESVSTTTSITPSKNIIKTSYASKCGFTVLSPSIGSKISFPLSIKGIIDNSKSNKLGCSWNEVLSRAGTAQIFYNLRNQGWVAPGVAVPLMTSTGPVASTSAVTVDLNVYTKNIGLISGTPIKISFTELKPLDNSKQDSFDMIVYLK